MISAKQFFFGSLNKSLQPTLLEAFGRSFAPLLLWHPNTGIVNRNSFPQYLEKNRPIASAPAPHRGAGMAQGGRSAILQEKKDFNRALFPTLPGVPPLVKWKPYFFTVFVMLKASSTWRVILVPRVGWRASSQRKKPTLGGVGLSNLKWPSLTWIILWYSFFCFERR